MCLIFSIRTFLGKSVLKNQHRLQEEPNVWNIFVKEDCSRISKNIFTLEVQGPSGPRLLVGGPSGLLTSSFAPFGRSGGVTHDAAEILSPTDQPTNEPTNKAILGVGYDKYAKYVKTD